jgi:hypothetical protein
VPSAEQVIFAGITGLVAASAWETLSNDGLLVFAPATELDEPRITTRIAITEAIAPRLNPALVAASL